MKPGENKHGPEEKDFHLSNVWKRDILFSWFFFSKQRKEMFETKKKKTQILSFILWNQENVWVWNWGTKEFQEEKNKI